MNIAFPFFNDYSMIAELLQPQVALTGAMALGGSHLSVRATGRKPAQKPNNAFLSR
jgi:hypothetical protein